MSAAHSVDAAAPAVASYAIDFIEEKPRNRVLLDGCAQDRVGLYFNGNLETKGCSHDDPGESEVSVPANGLGCNDSTRIGFALAPFELAA